MLMNPDDDGPAICEAIVSGYLQAFRVKEAMSVLEAWKRDYPGDPQPMVVRGMYFAHRQNWNSAANEFEAALKLAPDRDDIRAQWAESLRNLGQLSQAREQFEHCRQSSPRNPEVLIGLGRCLLESGDLDGSRQCFELALSVAPTSWSGRFWLGKLLVTAGESEASIPILEEVCRERPYEPDVRYTLAMALQATGHADEANKHFEYVSAQQRAQSELRNKLEILERSPSRTDLRFEIGKTLLDYGNPDEGLGWLQSVLQLDPNHPEARAVVEEFTSRQPEVPLPDQRAD
jgi:tetratricopeptide (TPR) repeat protein